MKPESRQSIPGAGLRCINLMIRPLAICESGRESVWTYCRTYMLIVMEKKLRLSVFPEAALMLSCMKTIVRLPKPELL